MIISRKKFKEAIEAAEKAAYEKMFERQRFDRLEEYVNRRMGDFEKRLLDLEHPQSAPSDNSHCGDTVAPSPTAIGYV